MRDVLTDINNWVEDKHPFAVATVIKTWGSAPRGIGSVMAVRNDMQVTGSVSGGCVENAVIEEAMDVIQTGAPKQLKFGVSDETAWTVGLSCGGKIKVFLEKHFAFSDDPMGQSIWQKLQNALNNREPIILLTKLDPEKYSHLLVYPDGLHLGDWGDFNAEAIETALHAYKTRQSQEVMINDEPAFIRVFPRVDQLIIIGAAHIAVHLVKFAQELAFDVVVIDPRQIFSSLERFPVEPQQLITQWPDEVLQNIDLTEDTYAVVLSHDPKVDDAALKILLKKPVSYIGALGSKKTHAKRCDRLREAGFSEDEISRISGPVGLEIGANTPSEIALSIIAEIVKVKYGQRKEV